MERNKFIFYKDWWEALRQMPEEMSRSIIEAIMNYALYGIDTDNPQIAYSIYALAKAQIDRDTSKYEKQAERNRINGAKSKGAPVGNQNARKQPTGLNSTQNNPNNPKQPNNIDIDINIDNNNDKSPMGDKEKKIKKEAGILSSETPMGHEQPPPANASARFRPPLLEEVRAYIAEKGLTLVDAERYIDYYTSNGWKINKNPMKDWKAALRNWNRREQEKLQTQKQNPKYGNNPFINRDIARAEAEARRDADFAQHIAEKLARGDVQSDVQDWY